ncbi:DUF4192 domain-containing protein [Streptomyces tritici]|uniref:DUF4192 domain-containing protein n=1 Tax=Streptomyces tritici TaxID=2054410 RepID=UPI003AF06AE9
MNQHHATTGPADQHQITLRGPAELADALPFVLGFHPTDSVVLVALHGERGRFGGRLRLGIPRSPVDWPATAEHLAESLVDGCERRGERPDGILVFLCQDPAPGESGQRVMERLRPFAQRLRTACGALDVPVYEALCISDGRHFSYCCPDARCCPPEGTPLALPGTSVMAAAAAYAGIRVRGTLREMEAGLKPPARGQAPALRRALDAASAAVIPCIVDARALERLREETLKLARKLIGRFERVGGPAGDAADDALVTDREAADVIMGLQDRETRDRAAEWMEGAEGAAALRLWRVLARRCVAPYTEHAAAPLTLAGWTAWSTGDEPTARVALGLALEADPDYRFARLLHQACNEGLDPESLRECLRSERSARNRAPGEGGASGAGSEERGTAAAAAESAPAADVPLVADVAAVAGSAPESASAYGSASASGSGSASASAAGSGSASGSASGSGSGSGSGSASARRRVRRARPGSVRPPAVGRATRPGRGRRGEIRPTRAANPLPHRGGRGSGRG